MSRFPVSLFLFAAAACVSARVQPRLLDRIVINSPTGNSGQSFETSLDNGVSWKAGAQSRNLDAQSAVGFRKAEDQDSAAIVQNALPAGSSANDWITVTNADPYIFEVGDSESYISIDYTKSPEQPITSGQWTPIRTSVDLYMNNGGICDDVDNFIATIYYKDDSAPVTLNSTPDQWDYPHVEYNIADISKVNNITFPFSRPPIVIIAGTEAPFVAKYASAGKAPRVTALMEMRGSFCNGDD